MIKMVFKKQMVQFYERESLTELQVDVNDYLEQLANNNTTLIDVDIKVRPYSSGAILFGFGGFASGKRYIAVIRYEEIFENKKFISK